MDQSRGESVYSRNSESKTLPILIQRDKDLGGRGKRPLVAGIGEGDEELLRSG